jgi:UDP-N-acetylmuramyl pentapeptide phosphotransferase/UDP-N-acetylglucosamine-1-phosphate transferase
MGLLLAAWVASFLVTMGIVRWARLHPRLVPTAPCAAPQNFHAVATPRLGGLGIVVGVGCASLWLLRYKLPAAGEVGLLLLACAAPAFAAGIAEDITRRITPMRRLLCTVLSASLAVVGLGALIQRTDIPGLDWLVSFPAGAFALTVFAVVGVANAVNIIDGFNGLASMCVLLMLIGLAYVGFAADDPLVAWLALAGVGAVLGFFVWNFPAGLVFLGDGGAYFLGFYLAELAILLLVRNAQVSPLFPLLLCIYPIFETVFSMYRRRVLSERPVGLPDGAHLHSLIHRRLLRWAAGERTARELTRRNSMTSPYLWALCSLSVVPAMLWWDSTPVLTFFIALFAGSYLWLYWRIVRFRAPRWMRSRRDASTLGGDPGDNRRS